MSTPCELLIYSQTQQRADESGTAVLMEAKRLEHKYNYFSTDSYLSSINKRELNVIDKETKTLLSNAKRYYKLTNSVFDITIATIKDIYMNSKVIEEVKLKESELLKFVGCEHFSIKKDKISFDNPYTKIDLGGFVKEYAVDRAILILKKHKIQSALVNFGGDIFALGLKPDGSKFKVGIKNPDDRSLYAKEVELQNQALTTSASYERNYRVENKVYSHILSKSKPTSQAKSVSVISKNCVESGVFSTSLMIDDRVLTTNRVIIL